MATVEAFTREQLVWPGASLAVTPAIPSATSSAVPSRPEAAVDALA
jgi:hypothetical protein